ncbi:MAG: ATP-binding cassette domain-containing protein [Granulosicoccus sp.]|nr:ATP-binding cassette domain-containing protein [Granulosicoccus sp.]
MSKADSSQPPESGSSTHSALALQEVSFHYGRKCVLDRFSASIDNGETVILLGPNGAGKTTLFSLICGLFAPDSGDIRINGHALLERADALAPLGVVFQSQTLDLDLSVIQNLRYFCSLHGIPTKTARIRIDDGLQRMQLVDRANDKVRTLNGGHRRRVEIIRATLHQPRILLLDEPTVGLDIPTRAELVRYIRALPATHHCAVLWATHLVDELEEHDRVLMLHQGKLHHDGRIPELLESAGACDLSELMQGLIKETPTKIKLK